MKIKRRITEKYFEMARHQYAPLIQRLAFRIGVNNSQVEEFKVRAYAELLSCMICYKRSGSFMTFFHGRLVDIFRHLRDAEIRARRVIIISMDSMTNIAGPDHDMDSSMMVQECLECLNEKEYDIITDIYFRDKTMREISNSRRIFASTVCRIKARAINKMKKKCLVGLE